MPPSLSTDQHVLALADRALREVARREELRESEAVGTRDLEAPLDGYVPERHAVQERVELRLE